MLAGFFPLTIVCYAYQFFPVTEGQFPGATRRGAGATIGLLAAGVATLAVGYLWSAPVLQLLGTAFSLAGATGYGYLLARRFVA